MRTLLANLLAGCCAVLILVVYPESAWADFTQAAYQFRDAATAVYQQGVDVCGGSCESELSGPLANLGASLGPLSSALAGGDQQAISDAVNNTTSTLQPLCTALRVDCPVMLSGPMTELEPDGALNQPCCSECDAAETACIQSNEALRAQCINNINEFVACRLQTPFCDWRTTPFDAGTYANCRSSSFHRQFLTECRCPVPPGQAEREGGCPAFFTQGPGQVGTGICEVPDGAGCARCCNSKCVGSDPRLSCRGSNREECDVCEWARRTLLAGNSMRTAVCEAPYVTGFRDCDRVWMQCMRHCSIDC